jgi:hypothetical protein
MVVAATLAAVLVCVSLHYEVLKGCIRLLPALSRHHRRRVLLLILIILATHVAEIWVFGFGYYYLLQTAELGSLAGLTPASLPEYVYYSAIVYTTVGFGDIVPTGPIRFMTGMEALTGFVMLTWSASFTYLEMQREWGS